MRRSPFCDLGGTQTPNLLIRSQMLYSVELRGQKFERKVNIFFLTEQLFFTSF